MDLKDPKNQRYILVGLVAFLGIYFWYTRVFSGFNSRLSQTQSEYERILSNLKNVEMKAKTSEALKKEYQELFKKYQTTELLLPNEKQVPALLSQLHVAGISNQVAVSEIVPKGTIPQTFYEAAEFDLAVTGSFHAVGSFFASIANFPFIVNIASLQVVGNQTGGDFKKETVTVNLKLTTYYVKESEKLQPIALDSV
ncbi:MAG: type 4a pilus biogenesis protein PilO [candidate division Zixibacteria bacterium]|nr:type 4a pilus biogenesis protein PilO [candidate division Zixibacteria bacterium]MCI0595236.1 type 4a pilus biogenesis protein PilO [candidate division Zixibacteria bacterium]